MNDAVEAFGELLVKHVRDDALDWIDDDASDGNGPRAKAWARLLAERLDRPGFEQLAADIVDLTLASLLRAIDQGELPLAVLLEDGPHDLAEDGMGELVGWYVDEWRSHYSTKPVTDYLADLD